MSLHPHASTPRQTLAASKRPFASFRSIAALILREMGTTYGRSPGGYVWAILEPVAGIALLSLAFSAAFMDPPIGQSFPMFYATGMMPFLMFNDVHGKVATSLMYSKQLLTYPAVTFIDAIAARFALNMMTQMLVSYAILCGSYVLFNTNVVLDFPKIVLAFGLSGLLGLGIGTLNCFLFTSFPLWQRMWSVIMRPMFLISGIIFTFEAVPREYQNVVWWNPILHTVGLSREGFYAFYNSQFVSIVYVAAVSLVCLAVGLLLLRRFHQDLLQK